jgi:membrane-associated protease RseP (regulator of RpoE activity)
LSIPYAIQTQLNSFDAFIKKNFAKDQKKIPIIGPLGIFMLIKKSINSGIENYILTLAFLSFNVALFNLLPLPFFDGGKIMVYTIHYLVNHNDQTKLMLLISLFIALFLLAIGLYKKNKNNK